jgi:hypothetical protein
MIITVDSGTAIEISSVALIPSITGILISISIMSGFASLAMNTASSPFSASPITSILFSKARIPFILFLVPSESSTITTLIFSMFFPPQIKDFVLFQLG